MADLSKMSTDELREKFGTDIDLGDGYALEFFDELKRRADVMEKALDQMLEFFNHYQGMSMNEWRKALKQYRGG